MPDLDLISTDDLIEELADRHKEKGFDLVAATEMLHATHWKLIHDYLDNVEEE